MFKKLTVVAVVLMLTAGITQATTWSLDKAHSSIGFSVRHMVISNIFGEFHDYDGVLKFDGKNVESGQVELTVQMASIDTDNEKRDSHLKTGDFFDVKNYPTMSFKSTKVSKAKDGKFRLTGLLTIKDVSKEVTFDCEFNGAMKDPMGNFRAGFSAETEINRQDFNVSFSKILDGGGLMVGDMVTINLEVEAIQATEQADSGK